ncbi:hypothetical protein GF406_05200 [candidate division KSB1 bacterium]|nr:hypothetical protein [candidate division KSB1 bacterium]
MHFMRNMMLFVLCALTITLSNDLTNLRNEVRTRLHRGVEAFYDINIQGGYVYHYTLDLSRKWGEGRTDDLTIEVQPPGTPAVGMSFLRVYRTTGDTLALKAARDAGSALIKGQNDLGGWEHKIHFNRPKSNRVSFDDNQTQSAIRFLMELDQEIDDPLLDRAIVSALDMMQKSQMDHGGWPHRYPIQNNYHDYATFNDNGINDCISVMIDAHRFYQKQEYGHSLQKAAWFMLQSQLPPPQPGWAQQYNAYLQPAWARSFEPASVCPAVTLRNVHTLIDLYLYSGQETYLEPILDALKWVESVQLDNGNWARFVEIYTNKPLYYDRDRIRVDTVDELSLERRTGYGYEQDLTLSLQRAWDRFKLVRAVDRQTAILEERSDTDRAEVEQRLQELYPVVKEILDDQTEKGLWIIRNDRFRQQIPLRKWNGEYEVADRISSARFNQVVKTLTDYLQLCERLHDLSQ